MPAPTRCPSDLTRRTPPPERRPPLIASTLTSLGWDEFFEQCFPPYADTHQPARGGRGDRGAPDVLPPTDEWRVALRPYLDITVGDWVAVPLRATGPLTV